MEFKKRDLLVKEDKSEDGIVKKVLGKLEKIKNRATSEVKETRALVKILAHAVKSYAKNRDFDLNKEDKDFIKGQSTDVIKNVILVLVALIPIPIPLTPFLIIFGKKIGIDLIPKEHDIPEKGKKDKDRLDENNQKIFDDENLNIIEKLCHQSKKRKLKSNTFCRLLDSYNNSNAKEKIITSLQKIFNFFIKDGKGINKGVFPKLVRISLDSNDFTHYLYIISEFLTNSEYEDNDLKIKLKRYKGRDYAPLHLDDIAKQIASKEYTDYEEKLTKDEFGISRTFLSLDYRCEESVDKKIIELLKIIKNLPEDQKHQQFETFLEKFIGCLKQQLDNPKYTIKADAINNLEEPIRYEGETILKKGDYLEIKKMDFEVDSYLSEFFSIFKESKIKYLKKTHILIYNYFVDRVFQWINENGQNYLNTVKNNLAGIIFDNNTFVPIDQIDFYWSNKGQRGCNEKRLSIRFRIKPGLQSVLAYIYESGKGENSLTQKIIRELPSEIRKKQICHDQLDPNFIVGENSVSKMNIILTEEQYQELSTRFGKKTYPENEKEIKEFQDFMDMMGDWIKSDNGQYKKMEGSKAKNKNYGTMDDDTKRAWDRFGIFYKRYYPKCLYETPYCKNLFKEYEENKKTSSSFKYDSYEEEKKIEKMKNLLFPDKNYIQKNRKEIQQLSREGLGVLRGQRYSPISLDGKKFKQHALKLGTPEEWMTLFPDSMSKFFDDDFTKYEDLYSWKKLGLTPKTAEEKIKKKLEKKKVKFQDIKKMNFDKYERTKYYGSDEPEKPKPTPEPTPTPKPEPKPEPKKDTVDYTTRDTKGTEVIKNKKDDEWSDQPTNLLAPEPTFNLDRSREIILNPDEQCATPPCTKQIVLKTSEHEDPNYILSNAKSVFNTSLSYLVIDTILKQKEKIKEYLELIPNQISNKYKDYELALENIIDLEKEMENKDIESEDWSIDLENAVDSLKNIIEKYNYELIKLAEI